MSTNRTLSERKPPMTESEMQSPYPVVDGYLLTPEFMQQEMIYYGVKYSRHPNGGGYVAESSLAPCNLVVPPQMRIGPNTRLLDDKNYAGLFCVEGAMSRFSTKISRRMTAMDRAELGERKMRLLNATSCSHVSR